MKSKQKTENRKALPLFIAIMIVSLLIGIGVGVAAVRSDSAAWPEALKEGFNTVLSTITPYVHFVIAAFLIIFTFAVCKTARGQIAQLKEDDEVSLARADRLLSAAMAVVNLLLIVSYFFMAALLCYIDHYSKTMFFAALVCFCVSLVMFIVSQQKFVDLTKKLYPEKRGSVYDMNFAKKWYESCDEAERLIIGQAARAAYTASQTACLLLWLLLIVSHMFLQTGLLPIAAVSIIWLATSIAYFASCAQLESKKIPQNG